MKSTLMQHQLAALEAMKGRQFFALFMDMGTGKTVTILAKAEELFLANQIDALLVIAPKSVHTNWVLREIPKHMDVPLQSVAYESSKKSRKYMSQIEALFNPVERRTLRILTMNIDAMATRNGVALATRFLKSHRTMMVVDESSRIKTPNAVRTKNVLALGCLASHRFIMSGLPVTNSPPDIFSQMEFLARGILGTNSYRSFVAEYSTLMPPESNLMRHIVQNARNPHAPPPQIVMKDERGRPMYRNLDKLRRIVAPHAFRVRKDECLDLPPKVYVTREFMLEPQQQKIYDELQSVLRLQFGDREPDVVAAIAALSKARQITSGFVMFGGEPHLLPIAENPRLKLLADIVEDIDGQFIIWAHYREEIEHILTLLKDMNIEAAAYHGDTTMKDREAIVDAFQAGSLRAFVGQPKSGGIGLTLTNAETVIYYSNDYNLDVRAQSEDRAHRVGTKHTVVYIDLVAVGTYDVEIAASLQNKSAVSREIMGDNLSVQLITRALSQPER